MMNTRSPYAGMLQQQQMGGSRSLGPQQGRGGAMVQQQRPAPGGRPQMGGSPSYQQRPQPQARPMGAMMSDEGSKKEIERLESANSALSKALDSKAEYPDTGAASSGMQALGQQSDPSRGSFADAPDAPANRVAAQNVAMRAPPPPPVQSMPQQQPQMQAGGFGFQPSMPNMTDLDEAYARMGQGG